MSPLSPTILPPERLLKKNKNKTGWFLLPGILILLLLGVGFVLGYPRWKHRILEPERQKLQKEIDSLKLDVRQSKQELQRVEKEFQQARDEMSGQKKQVAEYQKEMARLREQIKASLAEREKLRAEIKAKEDQMAYSWERVKTVEDLLGKSLTPRVMKINRPLNYVVINMGRTNQLRLGDKLVVERAGKLLATVEVDKLYDSFSSARIIQESKILPIEEGDSVEVDDGKKVAAVTA